MFEMVSQVESHVKVFYLSVLWLFIGTKYKRVAVKPG